MISSSERKLKTGVDGKGSRMEDLIYENMDMPGSVLRIEKSSIFDGDGERGCASFRTESVDASR